MGNSLKKKKIWLRTTDLKNNKLLRLSRKVFVQYAKRLCLVVQTIEKLILF